MSRLKSGCFGRFWKRNCRWKDCERIWEVEGMGIYLNPGNEAFRISVSSEIYVDKTELISFVNKRLGQEKRFLCVSRPRRFGKSMAAHMLCAYYDRECDSRELFQDLKIARMDSFEQYLTFCSKKSPTSKVLT